MFTPATTASNVSPPFFRISIAFVQARRPLSLETTISLADAAEAAARAGRAPERTIKFRLVSISFTGVILCHSYDKLRANETRSIVFVSLAGVRDWSGQEA